MANWVKDNKTPITVVVSAVGTIAVILGVMLTSINTIHYRLDDTNQRFSDLRAEINLRFDAQDQRLERLGNDVSELHTLIVSIKDRVSRNEGQINLLTQQLNTAETNPRPEPGTTLPPTDRP